MKDARRLKSKIARLATASGGHDTKGRSILDEGDSDGLTAVLREIDETILPRALTLSSARGTIVITAGNRRLIKIETVTGDELADVASVAGLSLTRPDVADLGRLRDALVAAFNSTPEVRVKSAPIPGGTMTFADGTTAAALASAWGIELISGDAGRTVERAPLDTFLASMPNVPRAWVQLESGKPKAEGGAQDLVARLKNFADSADMADLDMMAASEGSRFVAIGRAPDDGDCLLFVSRDAQSALLLLPSNQLETAKASWRGALS
ncbi:MAG: hypothetical protein AAFV87_17940 [Pseudomonadota bacterium]